MGAADRVVLEPHLPGALPALAPERGAVAQDAAGGLQDCVAGVQDAAAGGAAAAGQGDRGLARVAAVPRRKVLPAQREHLGRAGRPVAVLFVLVPPHHQQFAVGVAERRALPAVQLHRQPQVVLQQDALGPHDDRLVPAGEDQRRPRLVDGELVLAVPPGLGVQAPQRLVEGGPPQLVEDARAQGTAQQRGDVELGGPGDGLRADPGGDLAEGAQPSERGARGGQTGRGGQFVRRVLQPLAQDVGEHGMRGQLLQRVPARVVVLDVPDGVVQQAPQARVRGDGGEVPACGPGVVQPLVDGEVGVRGGHPQRDVLCPAQVQQIEVGALVPPSGEEVHGAAVGAQARGHALDEREGGR